MRAAWDGSTESSDLQAVALAFAVSRHAAIARGTRVRTGAKLSAGQPDLEDPVPVIGTLIAESLAADGVLDVPLTLRRLQRLSSPTRLRASPSVGSLVPCPFLTANVVGLSYDG
ncbi:hypothetical protein GCM10009661_75420 [Catellatospora chokoriensis]